MQAAVLNYESDSIWKSHKTIKQWQFWSWEPTALHVAYVSLIYHTPFTQHSLQLKTETLNVKL